MSAPPNAAAAPFTNAASTGPSSTTKPNTSTPQARRFGQARLLAMRLTHTTSEPHSTICMPLKNFLTRYLCPVFDSLDAFVPRLPAGASWRCAQGRLRHLPQGRVQAPQWRQSFARLHGPGRCWQSAGWHAEATRAEILRQALRQVRKQQDGCLGNWVQGSEALRRCL